MMNSDLHTQGVRTSHGEKSLAILLENTIHKSYFCPEKKEESNKSIFKVQTIEQSKFPRNYHHDM